ncbi:hypothetical protein cyc_03104 [Cyclospora cayetanensis]|uniref:Uncharacterized protein n=1 Tax=Cyclospora cayetanensis TaxID=88456 RepID=A0A1D3D493_9EIME|nr:hypothetical protein cyc_03104 [Cyclospora cayetanensis]
MALEGDPGQWAAICGATLEARRHELATAESLHTVANAPCLNSYGFHVAYGRIYLTIPCLSSRCSAK